MSAQSPKVVVIGFEMGDGRLFHTWAEQGLLPEFKTLLDGGRWAWLKTTAEQLHISAWPSIYTGAGPGEHGVYFTFQPAPALQGYRRFHPGIYGRPSFWSLAAAAGRRCAVLDPPYSHAEVGFDGNMVYDWGSWAQYLPTGSVPATLLREFERDCGAYPLGMEAHQLGLDELDPDQTGERLVAAVEAKTQASCWMLKRASTDLMFVVFGETHVAGHYCWTPDLQQADEHSAAGPMLAVYQALDRAVAEIRAAAGDDALILLVSGDAVGPNNAGWHLLPEVLSRLGYFAAAGSQDRDDDGEQSSGTARFDPVKFVRDLIPKPLRKGIANLLPTGLRDRLAQRVDTADIDWSKTRAYCLPTDLEGCIRINLQGREPQGIVAPGAEYETLIDDISAALLELREPTTGRPIVSEVLQADDVFAGGRRELLPDIVVRWHADRPLNAVHSERVGSVEMLTPDGRPGTHIGPGFLLAYGPGVAANAAAQHGHILDVAPTVLAALGVEAPATMSGRTLDGIASI